MHVSSFDNVMLLTFDYRVGETHNYVDIGILGCRDIYVFSDFLSLKWIIVVGFL